MDTALVEQALGGELEAFNQIVRRHQDHLFALVYRLVPDRDQAADVVQEAFFSAYRGLGSFRGGSLHSWLGRIAVNAAMDLQRARRRRPVQPYPELEDESWQPPADSTDEPEARSLTIERRKALAAALAGLPFEQRSCIVMFDVEGYDYSEIAQAMTISVGTVKSRIHRGRVALREALSEKRELFRG
jgi:RNA polymerase sigma-70 factor (ECF subfamily)